MTCKIDNEKTFQDQQPETKQCEACSLWCKSYHYRSCQDRFKYNADLGIDVFAAVKESNRAAQSQTGKPILPVDGIQPIGSSQQKQDKVGVKETPSKRHRRGK